MTREQAVYLGGLKEYLRQLTCIAEWEVRGGKEEIPGSAWGDQLRGIGIDVRYRDY